MVNIRITDSNLYVSDFFKVIKSEIINSSRPLSVNGRLSDAFVYVLGGSCLYIFDDESSFTAKEGDIIYLADKAFYKMYLQTEKYEFIFCDFLFNSNHKRKSQVYTPKSSQDTENLFRRLLRAEKSASESGFCDKISLLYKIYSAAYSCANSSYIEKDTNQKLDKIKALINSNYADENLSISTLAEIADMSEVYLRRLFKSKYGVAPSQYIISVRINEAKKLLDYPFLSIEECAKQCGFATLQYFSRVFKNTCGVTPSEYRKNKKDR